MQLNFGSVDTYFELLSNPETHGLPFRSLKDSFEVSDTCHAQHKLFEDYLTECPALMKIFFYICMEKTFGPCNGKDDGSAGYFLRFIPKPNASQMKESI